MNNHVDIYQVDDYEICLIEEKIRESGALDCIRPGMNVVLKPNWVTHRHLHEKRWDTIITHPAVLEGTFNIVLERLSGSGRISIVDAPMGWARFGKILKVTGAQRLEHKARSAGVAFEIMDLRDEAKIALSTITLYSKKQEGDRRGKVLATLKAQESEFYHHLHQNSYYGASEDIRETNEAHSQNIHRYSVSATVIHADVFVNLPKLKTHKKAGITCCLKNLVGINTNKNLLPHHTIGAVSEGGDQTPSKDRADLAEAKLVNVTKRILNHFRFLAIFAVLGKQIILLLRGKQRGVIRGGGWYGNDTIWRMILDLNKVMLYASPDGTIRRERKPYVAIVDAILAGQGDGPVEPDAFRMNKLIIGTNPVYVDQVCATLMGFDYHQISSVDHGNKIVELPITEGAPEARAFLNHQEYTLEQLKSTVTQKAKPALGWDIL